MVVDDVLEQETDWSAAAERAAEQAADQAADLPPLGGKTKGDVEFWIQVLQLVVLILILREVSR